MPTILVIDDTADVRLLLRLMLERAGYDVLEASAGRQGVHLFQSKTVDLVLLDLFMPDQEGLQTLRELQTLDPAVKVIVVSGGGVIAGGSLFQAAQSLGARRVVEKPIFREQFLATVREVLAE